MAEKFWPKEDAIGKCFARKGQEQKPITVVGIVLDAKYKGIPNQRLAHVAGKHEIGRTR